MIFKKSEEKINKSYFCECSINFNDGIWLLNIYFYHFSSKNLHSFHQFHLRLKSKKMSLVGSAIN
ncbi:MAG: hypothetical protein BM565_08205 [Gammaproteobacteria bacterium MedPE]|nr:MAG: hypothetical protein BM565_08205 [Gammaproteobacteria bacterium MedPE]